MGEHIIVKVNANKIKKNRDNMIAGYYINNNIM